jgi:hypothetical protein
MEAVLADWLPKLSAAIAIGVLIRLLWVLTDKSASFGDAGDPDVRAQWRTQNAGNTKEAPEYVVAASLMTYESNHFWTTFNSFVVALTVLAALLASTLAVQKLLPATIVVGGLGAVLCSFWFVVLQRARAYVNLRIAQAGELEKSHGFSLFRAGHVLAEGGQVRFDDPPQSHSMPNPARRIGIRDIALAAPWLYLALFLFLVGVGASQGSSDATTSNGPTAPVETAPPGGARQ